MTKVTRLLESVLTIVLVVYTYIYETSRCFVEKISKSFSLFFRQIVILVILPQTSAFIDSRLL